MAAAVKERPILFSAPMVKAILDGRKTMTRRLVKGEILEDPSYLGGVAIKTKKATTSIASINRGAYPDACPYGKPGGWLYVRERWSSHIQPDHAVSDYTRGKQFCVFPDGGQTFSWCRQYHPPLAAYYPGAFDKCKWKPSIHMPRWASRITLEITEVRVERLNDISEADAIAEGCKVIPREGKSSYYVFDGSGYDKCGLCHTSAWMAFGIRWDEINGAESFDENPWVWVVSFKRVAA